ncbi:hypothetical protein GCM10010106_24330 [Thermopolyspora flexuosa]|nr:hypothetical protein GCM10010106_24330 [Thermopolyspora flexuosa]
MLWVRASRTHLVATGSLPVQGEPMQVGPRARVALPGLALRPPPPAGLADRAPSPAGLAGRGEAATWLGADAPAAAWAGAVTVAEVPAARMHSSDAAMIFRVIV